MKKRYQFPKSAAFGRNLAKSKIYEYATPSTKIKNLFVNEVEKITWSYKLSQITINLPPAQGIHEIQVFSIGLKTDKLSYEILSTIDKAIPSPILFELKYKSSIQYIACYKRPNKVDKEKSVTSNYFHSNWIKDDAPTRELPIVLNIAALYQSLLTSISPLPLRKGESLEDLVARFDLLQAKEKERIKLENQITKEKQYNRRVELNRVLNTIKLEINNLKL